MSSSGRARRSLPTRWRRCMASRWTAPSAVCWANTSRSGSPPGTKPILASDPHVIIEQIRKGGGRGLVGLVGVQTNQFPRAVDIARPLRAAGIPVCIGGFHVSGCIAMLPDMPPELQEAMDLGITLFAGEAEGRLDDVLRAAYRNEMQPLSNFMKDLPGLEGAPVPYLPRRRRSPHQRHAHELRRRPRLSRFCAASARSSTSRDANRARAAPTTSSSSCVPISRRTCTTSSSPTTTLHAIRTGKRSSTG